MNHEQRLERAISLAKKIAVYPLMSRVGQYIADDSILPIISLEEACDSLEDISTEDYWLDLSNYISGSLIDNWHDAEYQEWNNVGNAISAIILPDVENHFREGGLGSCKPGGKALRRAVTLLGGSCLEEYYDDLVPTRGIRSLLPWFEAGHLPCGWEGKWPDGRLKVW